MKQVSFFDYFLGLGLAVVVGCTQIARAQPADEDTVEVVIHAERYASMHEYKSQQIKKVLKKSLSSYNLMEFTQEELSDMVMEVRRQQQNRKPVGKFSGKSAKPALVESVGDETKKGSKDNGSLDLGASQMKDMLKDYLRKNKDVEPLDIDPEKVKNIIINPRK